MNLLHSLDVLIQDDSSVDYIKLLLCSGKKTGDSFETALDVNLNGLIDDVEIRTAIQLWISGETVPGTDTTIDDAQIKDLIRIWITGERIGAGEQAPASQALAQPVSLKQASIIPTGNSFALSVQGQGIAQLNLQFFDLSGRRVLDETSTDMRLSFQAMDELGRRWANGVYLYIVTAYGFNGQAVRTNVGKFALVN